MTHRIALTLGDPAGIGPELILKLGNLLWSDESDDSVGSVDIVVFGSSSILDWTARKIPSLSPFEGEIVDVLGDPQVDNFDIGKEIDIDFDFGRPSSTCAKIQHAALVAAIDATLEGRVDAIVTTPWTKHILPLAGIDPTGHTEVLAKRCAVETPTMMLCGDQLRVALATTHLPLADVPAAITTEGIEHHLETLDADLRRRFGIAEPRIGVCGLNPHAGEEGVMGEEDRTIIRPAIESVRARGIRADGPFAADTLFARAVRSHPFDAILAMYHDQGLIPLKLWHFGRSANVTLGLPIIRTSVDHGTAYDIAGRGVADSGSFEYAIKLAVEMVSRS